MKLNIFRSSNINFAWILLPSSNVDNQGEFIAKTTDWVHGMLVLVLVLRHVLYIVAPTAWPIDSALPVVHQDFCIF